MRGILAFTGAGLLIALVMWSAAALLPACGAANRIALPWLDWCPVNRQAQLETRLAALSAANRDLQQAIAQRERELALKQCSTPPQTAALPAPAPQPPRIDRRDWDNRQIGLLEGCWELESRFVTTNRETGQQSRYNEWVMCFDASGRGREDMFADNGNSCSGPVQGHFNGDGHLVIEQPGDLPCSDGGFIYRLRSTCQLQDNGTASCAVEQPEVGGATTVDFRRAQRDR